MTKQTTLRRRRLSAAAVLFLATLFLPGAARAQWTQPSAGTTSTTDNVGIGTASPQDPLHIQSSGNNGIRVTSTNPANSALIRLYGLNGVIEVQLEAGRGGSQSADIQTYSNHDLWFGTNHTERMRITAGGNVGIGTAAPATALNIVGSGSGQAGAVRLDNGTVQTYLASDATQGFGQLGTLTNHGLNIVTNNSSKVFITAAGAVGIGTTDPSFGNAVDSKLTVVNAGTAISAAYSAGQLSFALNPLSNGAWTMYDRAASNGASWTAGITQRSGNIGIGTASPLQRLQLGGNTSTPTATPDAISLGGTYSSAAGANPKLRLYDDGTVVYGMGISNAQFDFMVPTTARYVWSVGGAEKMRLDSSGNVTVAGSINATYQDVAEWVPSSQKLSAGTVVVLDAGRTNHVLASTKSYDTRVAGVVSDSPGVILGVGGEGKLKVATTGRVKVKVDATRAPVEVGDLLVTGEAEGVAMKSIPVDLGGTQIHRPGTIIGKALEPLANGTGEILVLLSLQ